MSPVTIVAAIADVPTNPNKAEHIDGKENPRFVVTPLTGHRLTADEHRMGGADFVPAKEANQTLYLSALA